MSIARPPVPAYSLAGLYELAKRGARQATAYLTERTVSVASDETFERWVREDNDSTLMEYVERWRR